MKLITYGIGGYDPTKPNNNIVEEQILEDQLTSLKTEGVIATLNVVLGLWPIEDAANAVSLTPSDLVAEAQAWAAAQGGLIPGSMTTPTSPLGVELALEAYRHAL